MSNDVYNTIKRFFAFGAELNQGLPGDVREAAESGWNVELVERITSEVRKHFRTASRLAKWLTLLTCGSLFAFILYQVLGQPPNWLIILYLTLVSLLGGFAIFLIGSLVGTARAIHDLPDVIYRELMGPLWRSLDVLFIAINFDLFAYVFAGWNISTAYFILVLLAFLWICAPWGIHVAKRATAYIKVRIGQSAVLVVAALVCAASPIPMQHFQWGAQRGIISKLRPFEQTEITARWKTLEWFTQEGAPNVWYSNNPDGGYRLFSTPGTDKQTGEQLMPVSDRETKERIVSKFNDDEAALARKTELDKQERLAAAEARASQEKADALALAEKGKREAHERLVQEYVSTGIQANAGKRTALVVLNGEEQESSQLAARILNVLTVSDVQTVSPVFTSAFIRSAEFQDIMTGHVMPDRAFHPEDYAIQLLIIEVSETFDTDRPDGSTEMRTDDLVWAVKVISPHDGRVEFSKEIRVRGIGFKDSDAQHLAVERAEGQLKKLVPSLVSLL